MIPSKTVALNRELNKSGGAAGIQFVRQPIVNYNNYF